MLEVFGFTFRIMKKRPLRSLLTIIQLALGVWIVALILSFNFRTTEKFALQQLAFEDSLARISISRSTEFADGFVTNTTGNFRQDDLARLQESENIETAFIYEPHWHLDFLVHDSAFRAGMVASASWEYGQAMDLEMVEGQFFSKADQEQKNRVVVISEVISGQLFPDQSSLGQIISLNGLGGETVEYEVIGVYKPQSPILEYFIPESYLIFPLHYGTPFFFTETERLYHEIMIKATPGKVFAALEDAGIILGDRGFDGKQIRGEYFSDFNFFREQIQMMTIFLGAFAFVAILISALGILSIMLVSVVERTKEIGLRQALGAPKIAIVTQILNESFVFSILGVLLGLGVAAFTTKPLLMRLVQDTLYSTLKDVGGLHPLASFLSLLLATAVSQLFGLYPALQAGKIPPLEALRDN